MELNSKVDVVKPHDHRIYKQEELERNLEQLDDEQSSEQVESEQSLELNKVEKNHETPKGIDDALGAGSVVSVLTGGAVDNFILETSEAARTANPTSKELAVIDANIRVNTFLDRFAKRRQEMGDYKFTEDILQDLALLKRNDLGAWTTQKKRLQRLGVGIHDLNRSLKRPESELRRQEMDKDPGGFHQVRNGRLQYAKHLDTGIVWTDLCNFDASIVSEVTFDDGAEAKIFFVLEGSIDDGTRLPQIQVSSEHFASMHWTTERWGSGVITYAGSGVRDNLRVAIQKLSGKIPNQTIYGHTGWKLIDKKPIFLHGAGGIGEKGNFEGVAVDLGDPKLADFVLPDPPAGHDEVSAVLASLDILDLGPHKITATALAALYSTVLNPFAPTDYCLWFAGPTGVFKSEITALLQSHFGAGFHGKNLPANWSSTENSLEKQAHTIKDCFLSIDDYAPTGSQQDVQRLNRAVERLLRAQGNRAGRGRLRADATGRPPYFPRGLICSTGEDMPRGQSIRARTMFVQVGRGDLNTSKLTLLQNHAREGRFAAAMSGFIQFIAKHYFHLAATLPMRRAKIRDDVVSGMMHSRTPDMIAILLLGIEIFLDYAKSIEAISSEKGIELSIIASNAIAEASREQAALQSSEDHVNRFLELIVAALASGEAHVANADDGHKPFSNPAACGWRKYRSESDVMDWRGQGEKIGWISGDELWLQGDAAYAAAQAMARKQNDNLSITITTLWKRMAERGYIVKGEQHKHAAKRTIEGQPGRYVIIIANKNLVFGESASVQSETEGEL